MALLVKGIFHVGGGAPLGPIAGDQEEGVGQISPQLADLLGIGGPGDGAGHGEAILALRPGGDGLVQRAHHLVHGAPVGGLHVLKLPGAGVRGLYQDEGALVLGLGGLQEGFNRVRAHIAVQGDTVGVEGLKLLPLDAGPGQPALGIGGGGGADVPPLDVGNDEQAFALGIADGALQHLHALPAQILVIGGLGLHGGDDVAQGVHQPHIELIDGLAGPLQAHAVLGIGGLADVLGHILDAGIQSGHGGVLHGADLLLQNVKRHEKQSSLL